MVCLRPSNVEIRSFLHTQPRNSGVGVEVGLARTERTRARR
jgi:hypothetical protein